MEQRQIGQTNLKVDILGLGCAPLGGNFVDLNYDQGAELLNAALDEGISYFDTAPWYGFGRSERVVGDKLRNRNFIISSKVGRILKPGAVTVPMDYGMIDPMPFHPIYDYTYDGIMRAFEDSLQRLGLEKIDILLVHDIGTFQHGQENTQHFKNLAQSGYKALSELRDSKIVEAIGLGVNENQVCLDALRVGAWDVFLLAGRYTLLEQTALDELFPACSKSGTSIICGGPFNSGILVGREMWNYAKAPQDIFEKASALGRIAEEFNVPLAAAALQFPQANKLVSSVIPGPRSKAEVLDIIKWQNLEIPSEFWNALKERKLLRQDAPTP
jgi:D-threo-aldose 1-dehydrogenase